MTSADAILRIPLTRPELLFPGEADSVQPLYHRLASQWHPDRNPDSCATQVFQHIARLYATARRQIAAGRWQASCGETRLIGPNGSRYRIEHVTRRPHELGDLLIGRRQAAWLLDADAADLYDAGVNTLQALRYASSGMRREIAPSLPRVEAAFHTTQACVLVVEKPDDMVLLADLAEHLGGRIPPVHVAWVLSCLYNIACYLEWARLTHNAIGPGTVLVSPQRHACALLGGWWYAAPEGGRLSALPQRTVDTVPPDIVRDRTASTRADLELIRATGRELLGDPGGARLARDADIPQPLAEWLRHPGSGSALTDYRSWREMLQAAFGRPRFMRLDVGFDEVYPASEAP